MACAHSSDWSHPPPCPDARDVRGGAFPRPMFTARKKKEAEGTPEETPIPEHRQTGSDGRQCVVKPCAHNSCTIHKYMFGVYGPPARSRRLSR